jgi:signal transduction histidine kinase
MTKPTEKLLIVDDQPVNVHALYALFETECQVFMAASGSEALAACDKHHPDLILLDVEMPDMDGYEVCRILKSQAHSADIPVIFVTAHSNPEDEAAGLALGAVDYIFKPVNPAVVRARVHTQLDLRRAIQRLSENEQALEHRIAERTAELDAAREKLRISQEDLIRSEGRATLNTLVASVTHDMGTPLGNGLVMANTLAEEAKSLRALIESGQIKRSDLLRFLDTLNEGCDLIQRNLNRGVDLLQNFKQVAADQASEQRRCFDLVATVREVVGSLAPTLKRSPHRVEIDIPDDIVMDSLPGALGQVIINLVNNAWLHAFEGRNDGVLTIHAREENGQIQLRVSDNGVGIAPEHIDVLFRPFFSTKIGQGGTGLGTAIVHNLVVKVLGGTISVDSKLGEGTTFSITLPPVLPQRQD